MNRKIFIFNFIIFLLLGIYLNNIMRVLCLSLAGISLLLIIFPEFEKIIDSDSEYNKSRRAQKISNENKKRIEEQVPIIQKYIELQNKERECLNRLELLIITSMREGKLKKEKILKKEIIEQEIERLRSQGVNESVLNTVRMEAHKKFKIEN